MPERAVDGDIDSALVKARRGTSSRRRGTKDEEVGARRDGGEPTLPARTSRLDKNSRVGRTEEKEVRRKLRERKRSAVVEERTEEGREMKGEGIGRGEPKGRFGSTRAKGRVERGCSGEVRREGKSKRRERGKSTGERELVDYREEIRERNGR